MKTNGTRILLIAFFLYLFLVIISFSADAQPDYDFTSGSLISGTDKQVGAKYRFVNVRPGVDAIVTTTDITGGITLNQIDGNSGFKEAFQPVIDAPPFSRGYAEFMIEFVDAGTVNLRIMNEVPVTCIDVDGKMHGGLPVYEFDMVKKSPGIYVDFNLLGGELAITFDPIWITGTNLVAIDYPGVDTMAKQAMFTTVAANVNTMTVRVGADNQTAGSVNRLRSVYFKKFSYANSYLSKSDLLSFRGVEKNNKVEVNWELATDHHLGTVQLEKSTNATYKPIAAFAVNESPSKYTFRYSDSEPLSGNTYYRLKMISANGSVRYSNILAFRSATASNSSFKVYPSVVQSNATVQLHADKGASAVFSVVDMSGRVVFKQNLAIQEGTNNIVVNGFDKLTSGNYIAVVKTGEQLVQQKISKQ